MNEEWRDIVGYEGLYKVSNTGKVKALERLVMNNGGLQHKHERILKPNYNGRNRGTVVLCKEGQIKPILIYRIVAKAFIPNPENKPCVDHIDTDYKNNHVSNLRWCTVKENCNNPLSRLHGSQAKMGHPYWGKPHTDEVKAKISDALKGRKLSADHKEKIRQAHLVKKWKEVREYGTK